MSIETRLRETAHVGGVGGGGNSAGLAGTGATYILSSLNAGFPNALYIVPGSSVTTHITGSNLFINATTTGGSGTGTVETGTANYLSYYRNSDTTVYPSQIGTSTGGGIAPLNFQPLTSAIASAGTGDFWVQDSAGVTIRYYTRSTNFYAFLSHTDATTIVYAPTGAFYILSSLEASLPNALYIRPGSSVTTHITGSNLFINAQTGATSSGGQNSVQLLPQQAKLYASNSSARIDAGTAWWRLLFSSETQQYGVWQFMVPPDYGSSPFLRLAWGAGSSYSVVTSSTWIAEQFAIDHNITVLPASYLYLDTFGGANSVTIGLSAGYSSGTVQMTTINLATIVSLGANRLTHIRVSGSGQAIGDRILSGATFVYTRA